LLRYTLGRPDEEVIHFRGLDLGSLQDLRKELRQQLIGPELVKPVPAGVPGT
jgi:hypothetical protein